MLGFSVQLLRVIIKVCQLVGFAVDKFAVLKK